MADRPLLEVQGLDVFYGRAHALQGVSFTLDRGVLGLVGRRAAPKADRVPSGGSERIERGGFI